jgi:hypothetical protein
MDATSESQSTALRHGVGRASVPVALALAAGVLLRVWMLKQFPQVSGDTLIYGSLAKNLLLHGRFAITDGSGVLHSTLIRLPGYPLFLALCFRIFGVENYNAVAGVQIVLELCGCLLLADFVRRVAGGHARNTLAGRPLPLYGGLCGCSAHRDGDALRHCAGAVGGGPLPCAAGVGKRARLYVCGQLRGLAAARRCAGGRGAGSGAHHRSAEEKPDTKSRKRKG